MAIRLYQNALLKIAQQTLSWTSLTIKIIVLNNGYAFDVYNDFVSDLNPGANEVAGVGYVGGFGGSGRQPTAGKTIFDAPLDGVIEFHAGNFTWPGPVSAGTWSGFALWIPVTTDADSPLVCYGDPGDIVTGLDDVVLAFDGGIVFKFSPLL